MILFNSSMPRAGSTLLQNILGQNPDIHVTPTDGFLELIYAARVNFTNNAEFKAQDQDQMLAAWRGFCNEGMKGYVSGLSDKPNTCIKSRGIGEQFNWFKAFMGADPKVIVMVRNVKSVLASMEKIHRANIENAQQIQNPSEMRGLTTASRVNQWLSGAPVGLALQRLQQMTLEGTRDKCLIVRYEDLCKNTAIEMSRVYEYLGLPEFAHDFNDVEQITQEDDTVYGMTPDLHKVSKVVEVRKPDYIDVLGEGLCKEIDQMCAGYQQDFGYKA
jgi:sulfotransferase